MRRLYMTSLLASAVSAVQMVSNVTVFDSSSSERSCLGTTTYDFTPLETVYVTVDGSYTYTSTINGSTPTDIYYTPLPPCESVVVSDVPPPPPPPPSPPPPAPAVPSNASDPPPTVLPPSPSTQIRTYSTLVESWTTMCGSSTAILNSTTIKHGPYTNSSTTTSATTPQCSSVLTEVWSLTTAADLNESNKPHPLPLIPTAASSVVNGPQKSSTISASLVLSSIVPSEPSVPFPTGGSPRSSVRTAVTVTVTKKTPVPASTTSTSFDGNQLNRPTFPGDEPDAPITLKTTGPRTSPTTLPVNQPPSNNVPETPSPNPSGNDGGVSTVNSPQGPGSERRTSGNAGAPSTVNGGSGLGSIINSAFNSPFTAVIGVSTSLGAASATVTLVAGVPVQVGPFSVYIGGSNVVLPTGSSAATVTVGGQTFTVNPSAVIVGTSTLSFIRSESINYSVVQGAVQATSTVTQNGVVVTIGPIAAVISGTTFTIGLNAPSTTAVIGGQIVTFDNNGVVIASSTYAPALVTAPAYVVTTVGSITISIDQSQAIIDGTTFRIGAGSLNTVTSAVIDGTTISFGPSGIYLPSTTIAPTSVQLTDDGSESTTSISAATRVLSNSSGATSTGSAATVLSRHPTYLSDRLCTAILFLGLSLLPLALFL